MPETIVHSARRHGKTFAAAMEANTAAMRTKVQVARKQLGLDDGAYRAIIARVCGGKTSSTACGPSDLDALLREFRRLGWKPTPGKAGGKPRRPPPRDAQVRMIHGVWADLAPFVADPSDAGLRAFVARQTRTPANPVGVSAPEFLDSRSANKVLEGLKAWLKRARAKVNTPLPSTRENG